MTTREILLARIDALGADLGRAQKATQSRKLGELGERVAARFSVQLANLQQRAGDLSAKVSQRTTTGRDGWKEFTTLRNRARAVIAESLEFVEGALTRRAGLDLGVAEISDRLIDELADETFLDWSRLTIVRMGNYTTRSSGIVRLQYPRFDIWTIPIVAHEFGHHVASQLADVDGAQDDDGNDVLPVRALVDAHTSDVFTPQWLREMFCDIFGVYSVGPAFGLSLLLEWFDPLEAGRQLKTHPPAAWRAWLVLAALRDPLQPNGPARAVAELADELEALWTAVLLEVDVHPKPPKAIADGLRRFLADSWRVLEHHTRASLRFDRMQAAQQAKAAISTRLHPGRHGSSTAMGHDHDIRAVLTGAWLARIQGTASNEKISKLALALCARPNVT